MAASKRAAHLTAHQFKPGQSGNPQGRKKGCRPQLCEAFLEDLLAFWQSHGDELLARALQENPAGVLATIARLLPRDFELTVAGAIQVSPDLSDEQRARIAQAWLLSQQALGVSKKVQISGPENS